MKFDNRFLGPILITGILIAAHYSFGVLEGYERSALAIVTAIVSELVFGRLTYGKWPHLASAYITGISVGILVRSPFLWPYFLCSFISILSKYVLRLGDRHLWNPSNFGVSAVLFLAPATVSLLSIQWGNVIWPMAVIWILGAVIVWRVGRLHISAAYVASFLVFSFVRSVVNGTPWLANVAPITGPMYQLFIFFMVTDPRTTVRGTRAQIVVVVLVAFVEMLLRLAEIVYAPFYALFLVGPAALLAEMYFGYYPRTMSKSRVTACWIALTTAAAMFGLAQRPAVAQQAPASRPPLDIVEAAPNVHMIAGDGGNIAVQTGPDGLVLVDSGAGQRTQDVLAAIKTLSELPIRYILNTSAHPDHVGGNAAISATGDALGGGGGGAAAAVISGVRSGAARLAHENVLLRMSAPLGQKAPFPEAAWPTEGFIDKKNLYLNGEAIQILHQPGAHSDGDSIVFFRRSDVLVTGAIVDITHFPVIDLAKGGSIQGEIDALNFILDLAIPPTPLVWHPGGTQIIPARGRLLEHADVVEYRDMVTVVRDVVEEMIKKGMTLEQVRAAEPTRGYTRRYGSTSGPWTTTMFVDAVYASLTKGSTR